MDDTDTYSQKEEQGQKSDFHQKGITRSEKQENKSTNPDKLVLACEI